MNTAEVIEAILLAAGVAVQLLCCLGLLAMRNVFDRLHYLGPATTLGPMLLAAAVLVHHSSVQGCVKAVLLVVLLLLINPVLTHVTARAARVEEGGNLNLQGDAEKKA